MKKLIILLISSTISANSYSLGAISSGLGYDSVASIPHISTTLSRTFGVNSVEFGLGSLISAVSGSTSPGSSSILPSLTSPINSLTGSTLSASSGEPLLIAGLLGETSTYTIAPFETFIRQSSAVVDAEAISASVNWPLATSSTTGNLGATIATSIVNDASSVALNTTLATVIPTLLAPVFSLFSLPVNNIINSIGSGISEPLASSTGSLTTGISGNITASSTGSISALLGETVSAGPITALSAFLSSLFNITVENDDKKQFDEWKKEKDKPRKPFNDVFTPAGFEPIK